MRPCSSSEDLETRPELALVKITFQQETHGAGCFECSRRNAVIKCHGTTSGTWYLGVPLQMIEVLKELKS